MTIEMDLGERRGDSVERLRADLSRLVERVAALETRGQDAQGPPAAARDGNGAEPAEGDEFWALAGLQSRLADHRSTEQGAVLLVGSATLPTGEKVAWQQGAGTAGLCEVSWEERAQVLAALAHPVRVELLRHILGGTRTTSELAGIETLGTTGQLHHHLRQLLAAGWLRQQGRGSYEVPAARIVPLLACIVAGER